MGLYKNLDDNFGEVDVIIAGGGTAGCIVAARLAEADPGLSILVIEGGQDNYNNPAVVTPAMFLTHLAPDSKTALFYKARKSDQLAGREVIVPCGGTLGGGSSINFMMYTRAQSDDFDSWKTPGWTADELYPFLEKLETYHGTSDGGHHGHNGPVQVSDGTLRVKSVEDDFLSAVAKMGWQEIPDLQTLNHNHAWAQYKRYISPDGKRSDAAHMYLHPRLHDGKHPNLHVLVESQVVRVLFDNDKRANGVEYQSNPLFNPQDKPAKRTVRARKLVIVSSGACGTPLVLQRSGLGHADVLEKAGVPLVEHLPGVGNDYQDHNLILFPFKTSLQPHETLDELLSGRLSFEEAAKKKDPRLGWNTIDVAGKLRFTEEDAASLGPEFKAAWEQDFKHKPNRPVMLMALLNSYFGPPGAVEPGQYATMGNYTAYPYSRGHINITGPEVGDPLDFNVGFFTDAGDKDVKKQAWAYKKSREVMRRTSMYRGEVPGFHPPFPADSKAALVTLDTALDTSTVTDIEYSAEDERILEQFLRENVNTTWHSIGTCKMAPRDQLGVVDKDLNVYGVKGLKLADLSIPPENVAANTNNTALLVGEKAADIFIRELGLA
ncbi:GMC oxidoreductase [Xylaria bambusicola]|uniref:GMC oxidoreductase n=1 Tax=Xylaria bambusicola TaxID=326684 RepID=UPI0020079504|nr:GMC oxidoreductase [Xylaria bambusicola]KAI0516961.1 GMC oxidoreductase [Xylaria bambusicola]